jgi:hypothetical protein
MVILGEYIERELQNVDYVYKNYSLGGFFTIPIISVKSERHKNEKNEIKDTSGEMSVLPLNLNTAAVIATIRKRKAQKSITIALLKNETIRLLFWYERNHIILP